MEDDKVSPIAMELLVNYQIFDSQFFLIYIIHSGCEDMRQPAIGFGLEYVSNGGSLSFVYCVY